MSLSLIQPELVKCNLELLPSTPNSSPVWLALGCRVKWCWRTFTGMQVERVSAVCWSVKPKLAGILAGYVFFFYSAKSKRNLWSAPWHSFRPLYMCTHSQIQSIRYVAFSSLPRLNHSFHAQKSFFLAPSLSSKHHWMAPINAAYTQFWSVHFLKGHLRYTRVFLFFCPSLAGFFFFFALWLICEISPSPAV